MLYGASQIFPPLCICLHHNIKFLPSGRLIILLVLARVPSQVCQVSHRRALIVGIWDRPACWCTMTIQSPAQKEASCRNKPLDAWLAICAAWHTFVTPLAGASSRSLFLDIQACVGAPADCGLPTFSGLTENN